MHINAAVIKGKRKKVGSRISSFWNPAQYIFLKDRNLLFYLVMTH